MSENTITVKEFVDKYNEIKSETAKERYIKNIIKTDYIGYGNKIVLAKKIVDASSYEDIDADIKTVKVDSPTRFLLYVYTMIITYTDIYIDNSKMMAEYDLLNKNGLVDEIFKYISDSEKNEFDKIVSMVYEDLMTNSYEIHSFISNQVNKVSSTVKTIADILTPEVLEFLVNNIDKLNKDNILKILELMK